MSKIDIPLSDRAQNLLDEKPVQLKFLAKHFERYRGRRRKILADNARDYHRAKLLGSALEKLACADVVGMAVVEKQLGGDWRPFRVEHTLGGSLRGKYHGGYVGSFTGKVAPNLLESSSILFLRDEEGKTLRVLIPSHSAAREMLAAALKGWAEGAGYGSYFRDNTHLGTVVHNFALADNWSNGLIHTQTIDMLDASCERPASERPVVRVMGKLLQEGVALATGLEVNGELKTLLPTRFFAHLLDAAMRIGKLNPTIHLIPAI